MLKGNTSAQFPDRGVSSPNQYAHNSLYLDLKGVELLFQFSEF